MPERAVDLGSSAVRRLLIVEVDKSVSRCSGGGPRSDNACKSLDRGLSNERLTLGSDHAGRAQSWPPRWCRTFQRSLSDAPRSHRTPCCERKRRAAWHRLGTDSDQTRPFTVKLPLAQRHSYSPEPLLLRPSVASGLEFSPCSTGSAGSACSAFSALAFAVRAVREKSRDTERVGLS